MSLLLLLKSGVAAPPPTTPTGTIPSATIEIDFLGNPTATYADIQTTQDGAISFWRMNSATTFLDERLAHNGTIVSVPTTTASPYTYDSDLALQFDGSADGATVPSATDLISKGPMTVEGWLRVDSLPGSERDIVSKRGAWRLALESNGQLAFYLKDDNSLGSQGTNTLLQVGTWYHVAAVYDSTNMAVYINGVLDFSVAYSAGWEAGTQPIRFAYTPSAAVPVWQSSTTASGVGVTVTGTKPASTASGDLLIAHLDFGQTPTITTAPAGWTLGAQAHFVGGPSGGINGALYYKIAGASEPATYTWTLSAGSPTWIVAITRITGADSVNPLANPVWAVATNSTTVTAGAHTPNVDNNMVLAFFSIEVGTTWTQDSGTERYDTATGSNSVSMSSQTQASAASVNVTGTPGGGTSVLPQVAMLAVVAGATNSYAAVSMKDWALSSVARSPAEIARDYAAKNSGTGTWTDVSTSVRNWDVKGAGRQYELDQMEAGTTSVLLKDGNRYFDPANTSSVYSPNVIPMRKIRGRTTYQGTVYDLWYTYIERWPPQNQVIGYQEIGLTTVDGFDGLALANVSGTLDVGFSGTQINTLLDKALWPRTARAIDTGQYVMAGQTLSGTALSAIQDIAASERGIFFLDQAGVATFHDSAHRGSFTRSTQSQVTFIDSHSSSGIFYQGLEPSYDKDRIINDWTVTPDSSVFASTSQQQIDATSEARYWRRSNSRSTRLASNADALAQAGNLLNETAQPGLRFDSIKVLPTTTAGYQACLGLRISDRVTVIRGTTPSWDGAVVTRDCFIESREIVAVPSEPWVFTFALSPVSLGNYYGTIVRDGPVSYWRMDTLT